MFRCLDTEGTLRARQKFKDRAQLQSIDVFTEKPLSQIWPRFFIYQLQKKIYQLQKKIYRLQENT